MIFDKYPYSNFHELNDDWIIKTLKEFDAKLDEFVVMNSLTYADPILYAAETTYQANTVVIYNDTAYVSKKTAPAGILPTNDEYWLMIFPFGEMFEEYSTTTFDVLSARIDAALEAATDQLGTAINNLPTLVNNWMTDHPDVTTTVQNESITWLKLHPNLRRVLLDGYTEDNTASQVLNSDFEQGSLNNITGAEIASDTTCRTGFLRFSEGLILIRAATEYTGMMWQYREDGTFWTVALNQISINWYAVKVRANAKYRFTIQADDASDITPSDLPLVPIWYYTEEPNYVTKEALNTAVPVKFRWETGAIGSTGNNSGSGNTTRMRTVGHTKINASSFTLTVPTGYVALYYIYDETKTFVSRSANVRETTVTADITPGYYIRILAYNTAQTDVSPMEGNGITVVYTESLLDAVTDDNYTVDENASLSLFESIGVIGDSWASGSLKNPTTGDHVTTNYAVSWPQIIARKTGADVYNYSAGGLSTRTWLTYAARGLPKLLEDDPKNLYLIDLGINDNTAILAGTEQLGTIADVNVADFTQNPDTFYGNYGRIIGNVIAHAPDAKIICLSIARPGERNMDEHIEAIANVYGVPYVQLTEDRFFTSDFFNNAIVNGHPLAYGCSGMAQAIERLLIKCLIGNQYYFANYTGLITTP